MTEQQAEPDLPAEQFEEHDVTPVDDDGEEGVFDPKDTHREGVDLDEEEPPQ